MYRTGFSNTEEEEELSGSLEFNFTTERIFWAGVSLSAFEILGDSPQRYHEHVRNSTTNMYGTLVLPFCI
jgi:hypothetical protein